MPAAPGPETFSEAGGFISRTIFNEDMIYAGNAVLDRGQAIVYAAKARVITLTIMAIAQLKRNFDLAVSQADHPEVFEGIALGERGNRLVKRRRWLMEQKKPWLIPRVIAKSGFKYLGYLFGEAVSKLPI